MMGKWYREALAVSAEVLFWTLMEMMHVIRAPVIHLSLFLKKPADENILATLGNHLQQLVNGKASDIMGEYEQVGTGSHWQPMMAALSTDHDKATFFARCSLAIFLNSACGFHRRVVRPLAEFPFKLLRFIKKDSWVDCGSRREVARELIGLEDQLDVSTRKFVVMYRAGIHYAAGTGLRGHINQKRT